MAEIGCCTKYFLFFFNVLFWVIGLVLLGIGIWAWSEKGYIDSISVISSLPIDPVLIIIVIAMVMFVLSFAGCIGSLRENICLLKVFSIGLGIIFFAELIGGVLGFIYKDWFRDQFATFLDNTIMQYRSDPDLQNIIDFSQEYLQCCGGAGGPEDWNNNVYFNCSSRIEVNGIFYTPMEACGVPFSCCVRDNTQVVNTQCGFGVRNIDVLERTDIYNTGCIDMFEDWLRVNLYIVAGVLIGVALIQIIPICFAQNLTNDIQAVQARWVEGIDTDFGLRFTSIAQMSSVDPNNNGYNDFDPYDTMIASKKIPAIRTDELQVNHPNEDWKSLQHFPDLNPEGKDFRRVQSISY